jgi:HAE1 family hydrophobic/amphiphilic exporter-1
MLMARFGKLSDETRPTLSGRFSRFVEKAFDSLKNWYAKVLNWGLRHKISVLVVTIALLFASFLLFPTGLIGIAFMPQTDEGEFVVNLEMNPQVTVYQNNHYTMQAEEVIKNRPEVERYYTNVGTSEVMVGNTSKNNQTSISVKMINKNDRKINVYDFAESVKKEIMEKIPGIRARVSIGAISGSDPVQIIIQGVDYELIQSTANMVLNEIRKIPGVTDAKFSIDDPRQELQVKLDREKMAKLGLSVTDVGSTLRVALNGNDNSKYREGNFEYDILVRADGFDRTKPEDVAQLTFLNNRGELIELQQFADIKYGLGPSTLERTDRISSITVKSNVVGRPTGTVGAEISQAIKGKIPADITIKERGSMEQQGDAFGSLGFAFLAAIVMIYLIMVVLYDSLLHPFVVLFSIPLSFVGAFLALALTMNDLNIFSIIGLIVLIGLVAKNAILIVDFTNHMKRDKSYDTFTALIEAGKERLRPILMTTFAMIFGMLPIALASGDGAEMKNGMAWVIIGGLASSMILTLIVVPVVYYIFDKLTARFRHFRRNRMIKQLKDTLRDENDLTTVQA